MGRFVTLFPYVIGYTYNTFILLEEIILRFFHIPFLLFFTWPLWYHNYNLLKSINHSFFNYNLDVFLKILTHLTISLPLITIYHMNMQIYKKLPMRFEMLSLEKAKS